MFMCMLALFACTICILETRILPFVGSMNNSGAAHAFWVEVPGEKGDLLALGLLISCSNASLEIHPAMI